MTMFICFAIAMVFLYLMQLFSGGFNFRELLSFLIMFALLGSHVYLVTRKKAIFGLIVPTFILLSFYPVYQIIDPAGKELVILIGIYAIALGCSLYLWRKARKENHS